MEIKVGPGGKINHSVPQQKWRDANNKIMQTSLFAGLEMMVIQKSDDEPTLYELHYLGFITDNIEGIEKAKSMAPEFAKAVLNKMHEMIEPK